MNKTYKITINHKNGPVNRPDIKHYFTEDCKADLLKRIKKGSVLGEIGYPRSNNGGLVPGVKMDRYMKIQEDRVVIRITNAYFHKGNGIVTLWFQFVDGPCKEWLEQEFIKGKGRPGIRAIGWEGRNAIGEPAFLYQSVITFDFIEKP